MKDSIAYGLQEFFFDDEDMEEVYAKRNLDEVVLYFENEEEKVSFESYVEHNLTDLETNITDAEQVYFTVDTGNKRETKINIHRLTVGLALNIVFQNFKKL